MLIKENLGQPARSAAKLRHGSSVAKVFVGDERVERLVLAKALPILLLGESAIIRLGLSPR